MGELMGRFARISFEHVHSFREGLKFLRKRSRLTQAELARAVGYSREQITHLESGRRKPDPTTVAALFIPALDLQEEPELAARLLNLAEAVQSGSSGSVAETDSTAQAQQNHVADEREDSRVAHRAAAEVA